MTGEEVRQLREALGWSQERLAEFLGVDRTSISHMENGRVVRAPLVKLLDFLAKDIPSPHQEPSPANQGGA